MKRLDGLLLTLFFLLLFSASGFRAAAQAVSGDLRFYEGEDLSSGINTGTWSLDTVSGVLRIEGSGYWSDYFGQYSNHPWGQYENRITKVVLGEKVLSVAGYAFSGCDNLSELVLPGAIRVIGKGAFYSCPLSGVSLPSSVTTIEEEAFAGTNIESVVIPGSVTTIGKEAFKGTNIEKVFIPASVTTFGRAFVSPFNKDTEVVFETSEQEDAYHLAQQNGYLSVAYAMQYYGLPYTGRSDGPAHSNSSYAGKLDALTDCYQLYYSATTVVGSYYDGSMSAYTDPVFSYYNDNVWSAIYYCLKFMEYAESAMDDETLRRSAAEAKCIIAARYFDMFSLYGGLPIVKVAGDIDVVDSISDISIKCRPVDGTRSTVEQTVEHIVSLLDEAIAVLPWKSKEAIWQPCVANSRPPAWDELTLPTQRWSKAAAMALKAKVLTYAASPLFNSTEPYFGGGSRAEQSRLVWYGDYEQSRWERALQACKDFFDELAANGGFALKQASGTNNVDYRLAYRKGYFDRPSGFSNVWGDDRVDNVGEADDEILLSTRVYEYEGSFSRYDWVKWVGIGRHSYLPTAEYMEMFPWSDGTAFDWEADQKRIMGTGNTRRNARLFYRYVNTGKEASRDPRLYEDMLVNGDYVAVSMEGQTSSDDMELWVGGAHAQFNVAEPMKDADNIILKDNDGADVIQVNQKMTTTCATGFALNKYVCGYTADAGGGSSLMYRHPTHWVYLGLSEMYLLYAECLAQNGDIARAIAGRARSCRLVALSSGSLSRSSGRQRPADRANLAREGVRAGAVQCALP